MENGVVYRVAREKVLIRPDRADVTEIVEGIPVATQADGLLVAGDNTRRGAVSMRGTVIAEGPHTDHLQLHGSMVLFNPWAAVEVTDETVLSRRADLAAFVVEDDLLLLGDRVAIVALPPIAPVTQSGIVLTERYVQEMRDGFDSGTFEQVQFGVGMVVGCGPDADTMINMRDWVLFEYHKALYYQEDDGPEWVILKDTNRTVLAGMPWDMVLREYGTEAESLANSLGAIRHTVAAIG